MRERRAPNSAAATRLASGFRCANCSIAIRSSSACSGSNSKVSERSRSSVTSTVHDVAHLELVGDRRDRALLGLQHAEADRDIVGQDRARPAARPERADRGQRQHLRLQRQDRAVARTGCRRSSPPGVATSTPSADQFGHDHAAVDANLDLGRLAGLAQQRHFVDRGMGEGLAADRRRLHLERRDADTPWPPRSARRAGRAAIRSSGSRPCRGSSRTPAADAPSSSMAWSVWSMKPSPPSATSVSASSGVGPAIAAAKHRLGRLAPPRCARRASPIPAAARSRSIGTGAVGCGQGRS